MKINSKILSIVIVVLVAITISAAGAIEFTNFSINLPAECDFSEQATTNISANGTDMALVVYENTANNSKDISSIVYFNDSRSGNDMAAKFLNDLKKGNDVVEENANCTIVKLKNPNIKAGNVNGSFKEAFDFASSFIPKKGLNFSVDGDSVAFSKDNFSVSEAEGDNISISSKGMEFSDKDNSNGSVKLSFDDDITPAIKDDDYVACLSHDNQVVLIGGDNLALIKQVAASVKFN